MANFLFNNTAVPLNMDTILGAIPLGTVTSFTGGNGGSGVNLVLSNGYELFIQGQDLTVTGTSGNYSFSGTVFAFSIGNPSFVAGVIDVTNVSVALANLLFDPKALFSTADMIGSDGADPAAMYGYGGNDTLTGWTGIVNSNDLPLAGDTLYGGDGDDLLSVLNYSEQLSADVFGGTGNDTLQIADGDWDFTGLTSLPQDIETIEVLSSLLNPSVTVSAATNLFTAPGVTRVSGFAQVIAAGAGTYDFSGVTMNVRATGSGTDRAFTFQGSTGADTFVAPLAFEGATSRTYYGGDGNDTLTGGASDEHLFGDGGLNLLYGDAGLDTLTGGGDAEMLFGGADADLVFGDTGDDNLSGGDGADTMNGGADNDTVSGENDADLLTGGDNADSISGGAGDDTLTGDEGQPDEDQGNDTLNGGTGADTMEGNGGDDLYIADALDTIIELNGTAEGRDTLQCSISTSLLAFQNIENLTLTGTMAIDGTGNAGDNVITGNAAANYLIGGGGLDTLQGGDGSDTYQVGAGVTVIEGLGAGTDTALAFGTHTLAANVEYLTLLGSAAANLTGNAVANRIIGNDAANRIDGGALADTLIGFGGHDTYVYSTGDVIIEFAGGGNDTILSTQSLSLVASVENLVLIGNTAVYLYGNNLANRLTGNNLNNRFEGRQGADTMIGGAGNDEYYVGTSETIVIENINGGSRDSVYASRSYTLTAGSEIELLRSNSTGGAINLAGNEFAQQITGSTGRNTISGAGGADTLTGGSGPDIFVFDTAESNGNADSITDFSHQDDTFHLENSIFTRIGVQGELSLDAFWANDTGLAHDRTDRIIYNTGTGALTYDSNGSLAGGTIVVFAISLNKRFIDFHDFLII
jgi:Ca2+-binding RTX toxin-like protein